jgi:hypothetical protein
MSHNTAASNRSPAKTAWSIGGVVFGATMMVMIGIFQILMGISAISNDPFFVSRAGYVYRVNTDAWGWIHLGLGVLILLAGIGLFTGATWAKIAGIVLVGLSAIDNFLFLPYYPFWSLLLIALDVFVIWALAYSLRDSRSTGDLMADTEMGYGGAQTGQRWAATNPSAGYRETDPEAARRASDMATPAGARHAAEAGQQGDQAMSVPSGGSAGGAMPGATGMPGTEGGQPRPPVPPNEPT